MPLCFADILSTSFVHSSLPFWKVLKQ